MEERMGDSIVDVLEQAGRRYLGATDSRAYSTLLLHIGGTDALRAYRARDAYWKYVQAILDTFFTSAQRAEIYAGLIARPGLRTRAEFRSFLAQALAELRLQELVAAIVAPSSAIGGPRLAPARRAR